MADRIVILDQGRVAQVGTPLGLYREPANLFVAGFLGSPRMNFIRVTEAGRHDGMVRLRAETGEDLAVPLPVQTDGEAAVLGIRSEHLALDPQGQLGGRVVTVERLGSETLVYVETQGVILISKTDGEAAAAVGDNVRLRFNPALAHLFAASSAAMTTRIEGVPN